MPVDDLTLPPRREEKWEADGAGGWEKRGAGKVVFLDGKWRVRWLVDFDAEGDLFSSPLGEFDSAEEAMNAADGDDAILIGAPERD